MYKTKYVCNAKGAGRICWEVEQDNLNAIKLYTRLGADFDVKGFSAGILFRKVKTNKEDILV